MANLPELTLLAPGLRMTWRVENVFIDNNDDETSGYIVVRRDEIDTLIEWLGRAKDFYAEFDEYVDKIAKPGWREGLETASRQ